MFVQLVYVYCFRNLELKYFCYLCYSEIIKMTFALMRAYHSALHNEICVPLRQLAFENRLLLLCLNVLQHCSFFPSSRIRTWSTKWVLREMKLIYFILNAACSVDAANFRVPWRHYCVTPVCNTFKITLNIRKELYFLHEDHLYKCIS